VAGGQWSNSVNELQHNDYLAKLLDVMGAMPGTADPRALAERMLDRMRAQKLIVSGGVWLRTDGPITLLAHSGLGPQSILRSITMIIEDSALATLAHTQGDWQGDWHGQPLTILPFKAGETYIGALAVITDAPPTEQECMALQAIRAHLNLALTHALFQQTNIKKKTKKIKYKKTQTSIKQYDN